VVDREEEAIKLDGLSVAEMKNMRERAEKHAFQVKKAQLEKHCFLFCKILQYFAFSSWLF
jgi:hypothetical protein